MARIAALHATAWRETYRGLLPEAVIAAHDQAACATIWRARLEAPPPGASLLLVEGEEGAAGPLLAFGACGPRRDAALPFPGEFEALYVLRRAQRAGIGRALMRRMAAALLEAGIDAAGLWVLRANLAARAFYTELGGTLVAARENPALGAAEVAYAWRDLRLLAAASRRPEG
ncbi:GNAT family N-acetyltransferase [Caldovatus aquaticus]|uniref:GNAT family N-acetyltransferase n=1 Tax=Caldovatus aquaticus TaxID=2865671 RepID=UPI001C6808A6